MKLSAQKPGNKVSINGVAWKVLRVKGKNSLEPDSLRRRPEVIRSDNYAILRNIKTGRLRTAYFAEHIDCQPLHFVLTKHGEARMDERRVKQEQIDTVLKYGEYNEKMGRRIWFIDKALVARLPELKGLNKVRVVTPMNSNVVLTTYKVDD